MGISLLLEARVKLEGVLLDLTELKTVVALAKQLRRRGEPIDAVIWNAAIGGWKPLDFMAKTKGAYAMLTDTLHACTYPDFVPSQSGLMTRPQLPQQQGGDSRLGQVFAANTFGHYMLTHYLSPLMTSSSRVVWVSSLNAYPSGLNFDDFQGVRTEMAYESSKRLTDILVLTSELPSTKPYTRSFLTSRGSDPPRMYLTQPGLFSSAISKLDWFNSIFMVLAFYLCQLIGSPWHNVVPYKAAVSAVWVTLAPPEQIEDMERIDGKGKWGSSTDYTGDERVARTEVEGWGFGGIVGKVPGGSVTTSKGRYRLLRETNRERREEFEDLGRQAWKEMENLRTEWEKTLEGVETNNIDDV